MAERKSIAEKFCRSLFALALVTASSLALAQGDNSGPIDGREGDIPPPVEALEDLPIATIMEEMRRSRFRFWADGSGVTSRLPRFGVLNFGLNNSPLIGGGDTTKIGGKFGFALENLRLPGLSRNSPLRFGIGVHFDSGSNKENSSASPPPGFNSLLFPVAGGGAIGASTPIFASFRSRYRRFGLRVDASFRLKQTPRSSVDLFTRMQLENRWLKTNTFVTANNLAYGLLSHNLNIRRRAFMFTMMAGVLAAYAITDRLAVSGRVFGGLTHVNMRQCASSCLDNFPAPGCDGLFSTASNSSKLTYTGFNWGLAATLTYAFACSSSELTARQRRALLGAACMMAMLHFAYESTPFGGPTHQTALGQNIGLRRTRLNNASVMMSIAIPLALLSAR